jgi:hypothetical protein
MIAATRSHSTYVMTQGHWEAALANDRAAALDELLIYRLIAGCFPRWLTRQMIVPLMTHPAPPGATNREWRKASRVREQAGYIARALP